MIYLILILPKLTTIEQYLVLVPVIACVTKTDVDLIGYVNQMWQVILK